MKKQFPWVKRFWESSTSEQQVDIASKASAIRKFSTAAGARNRALELLKQLCETYPTIKRDCGFILDVEGIHDTNIVPCSDLEFMQAYFEQFPDMVAAQHVAEEARISGKKYRIRNDYWGEVVGVVTRESPSSLYFKCYRGDDVVIENWRLAKDSNRIIGGVE